MLNLGIPETNRKFALKMQGKGDSEIQPPFFWGELLLVLGASKSKKLVDLCKALFPIIKPILKAFDSNYPWEFHEGTARETTKSGGEYIYIAFWHKYGWCIKWFKHLGDVKP